MNFKKLFESQQMLMDRIESKFPQGEMENRFAKRVLALLVEVGETANEWRGFKFWSMNQRPNTRAVKNAFIDAEDAQVYNPLLEEMVDILHFVLEMGLVSKVVDIDELETWEFQEVHALQNYGVESFLELFNTILRFRFLQTKRNYNAMLGEYLSLVSILGYDWEDITKAYFEKLEINFMRQASSY